MVRGPRQWPLASVQVHQQSAGGDQAARGLDRPGPSRSPSRRSDYTTANTQDLGFVHPPTATGRPPALPALPLLDLRSVALRPSVDRRAVHTHPTLLEHLVRLAAAHPVPAVPAHSGPVEEGRLRRWEGAGLARLGSAGDERSADLDQSERGLRGARERSHASRSAASAAASRLRLIAAAVRKAWMRMLSSPRRTARARPCQVLASPWKPSDRQRWR